jgi:hypothetical protein
VGITNNGLQEAQSKGRMKQVMVKMHFFQMKTSRTQTANTSSPSRISDHTVDIESTLQTSLPPGWTIPQLSKWGAEYM